MRQRTRLADIFADQIYSVAGTTRRFTRRQRGGFIARACLAIENCILGRLERRVTEFPAHTKYWGNTFYFPSRSIIGQMIVRGGVWDAVLPDLIETIVGPPRVVLEIGSNIGASIIPIKTRFPGAELVLVEPLDRYSSYLEVNVRDYSKTTIVSRQVVSDTTGTNVYIQANFTTATPSNANYGAELVDGKWLPTVTCDDLAHRLGLGQGERIIDFLKVDTDGYEEKVFRGARKTIRRHQPLIFFEFSPPSLARIGNPSDLITLLQNELDCSSFVVLSMTGKVLGHASSFEQIMRLKRDDYYVDVLTTPTASPWLLKMWSSTTD